MAMLGWLPSVLFAAFMALCAIIYWLCNRGEAKDCTATANLPSRTTPVQPVMDNAPDRTTYVPMLAKWSSQSLLSGHWRELMSQRRRHPTRSFTYAMNQARAMFTRRLPTVFEDEREGVDSSSGEIDPNDALGGIGRESSGGGEE